jgi:hypothetical protein
MSIKKKKKNNNNNNKKEKRKKKKKEIYLMEIGLGQLDMLGARDGLTHPTLYLYH